MPTSDVPGGTPPAYSELTTEFYDSIGRDFASDLSRLRYGAGEGFDQEFQTLLAELTALALSVAVDNLVQIGVADTSEDALRATLGLTVEACPTREELATRIVSDLLLTCEAVATAPAAGSDDAEELDNAAAELTGTRERGDEFDEADLAMLQGAGIAPVQSARMESMWTLSNVIVWLRNCFNLNHHDPWRNRWRLAKELTTAGMAQTVGTMVHSSNRQYGIRVHEELARRFLKHYGPESELRRHEVMIERTVHRADGQFELSKLRQTAPRYRALWIGLLSPRWLQAHLRTDLVNLTTMELYEVKPVDGLAAGVAQVYYYTAAHNCAAQGAGLSKRLIASDQPLDKAVLRPISLRRRIDVSSRPQWAFPFQLKELPGLIGYVTVTLPSLNEIVSSASLETMRRLARLLKELRGPQHRGGPAPEGPAPIWAMAIAVAIALLLLCAAPQAAPAGVTAIALGSAPAWAADSDVAKEASPQLVLRTFMGDIPTTSPLEFFQAIEALSVVVLMGSTLQAARER